jgi:monoterpene epsilon-lactone hydrolase
VGSVTIEPGSNVHAGTMQLPSRTIPLPMSISEKARSALAAGAAREVLTSPEVTDLAGWRALIDAMHARVQPYVDMVWSSPALNIDVERIGGVDVYVVMRKDLPVGEQHKINYLLHGGGWAFFGGRFVALPAAALAGYHGGVVYAVDYRMPPDHPYPAALDDCLSVYRELLARFDPRTILVSGESAGGNLAGALLHRARDVGLPTPGAMFLNTPALDLTHSSDSIATNYGVDVVLGEGVGKMADLYRNGADARSPYLSPLLGDLTRGFPPTYLRTGTRDLLLSDTVRMHAALRKAGVEADLYVGEAMPHAGFAVLGVDTPEDEDARADLNRWLARHWCARSQG